MDSLRLFLALADLVALWRLDPFFKGANNCRTNGGITEFIDTDNNGIGDTGYMIKSANWGNHILMVALFGETTIDINHLFIIRQ